MSGTVRKVSKVASKSRMTRIGIGLFAVLFFTFSLVAMLILRRNTSGTGNDPVLVSKWGVRVSIDNESIFKTEYRNKDDVAVVRSSTGEKLIAPGRHDDEGMTIHITGKPEVATKVAIELNINKNVYVKRADGTYYYPLVFTLRNMTTGEDLHSGNMQDMADYLDTFSETARYEPNTDLECEYKLFWEWAWEGDDELDTKLGDLAAGVVSDLGEGIDYCLQLDYTVAVSVMQTK